MDSIQDHRKAEDHRKYAEECVTMALSSVQAAVAAKRGQQWTHPLISSGLRAIFPVEHCQQRPG
jgi:hypothetical protein